MGTINEAELSVKRVTRLGGEGTIKAFCDVAIGEAFLIRGVKVVDGKRGLFVSTPREQGKNGLWYDTVVPMTPQAKRRLSEVVLEAYQTPHTAYPPMAALRG